MFDGASALVLLFTTYGGSYFFNLSGPHRVVRRRNNGTVYGMLGKMLAHNNHFLSVAIITNTFAFKLSKSQNTTKGTHIYRSMESEDGQGFRQAPSYSHLLLRDAQAQPQT